MSCQGCLCSSKIGPAAKPTAGRTIAAVAVIPAMWTVPVMKRRRVTVSPGNAPGIRRSDVYFDLVFLRSGKGVVLLWFPARGQARLQLEGPVDPTGRIPG